VIEMSTVPPHPFAGIDEKLKRSNENIFSLKAEVDRFFEEGKFPVLPSQNDKKLLLEAIQYHKQREVPLRFSVLVGEIAHHLRSILDHIVWQFSTPTYRREHSQRIEFPILKTRPADKEGIKRYEGKIKGIAELQIRSMIGALQPYNAPDPLNSPLLIIHNMDIFDKHRELVLCHSTGAVEMPISEIIPLVEKRLTGSQGDNAEAEFLTDLARKVHDHYKVVPMISFRDLGRQKLEPVIPLLADLHNHVVQIVKHFADKLPQIY
jgi:hypothetical protein